MDKVDGRFNPADMFTKHVPAEVMWRHMGTIGFENREGRAAAAVSNPRVNFHQTYLFMEIV